jgi:hypothetical protein
VDLQVGAVAHAPDEPLGVGRYQLAVPTQQPAVGVEVHDRVVDGAAVRLALVDPHHEVDAGGAGGSGQALGHRAGHDHRLLQQPQVPGGVLAGQDLVDPGRPGRQERLGEDHQPGPLGRRLLDQALGLVQAGLGVQEHRGRLDRRHLDPHGVAGLWMTTSR